MEVPFYIDGERRGNLTISRAGERTILRVNCRDDGRGVYRGTAVGTAGQLPLGVLMPDGGMLRAERSLTAEALAREEIGEILRGEGWLSYKFPPRDPDVPEGWRPAGRVRELFRDPILAAASEQIKSAFVREGKGRRYLAVPWKPEQPFLLTPLFCFASIRPVGEERCAVFALDREGWPVMESPPEGKQEGA